MPSTRPPTPQHLPSKPGVVWARNANHAEPRPVGRTMPTATINWPPETSTTMQAARLGALSLAAVTLLMTAGAAGWWARGRNSSDVAEAWHGEPAIIAGRELPAEAPEPTTPAELYQAVRPLSASAPVPEYTAPERPAVVPGPPVLSEPPASTVVVNQPATIVIEEPAAPIAPKRLEPTVVEKPAKSTKETPAATLAEKAAAVPPLRSAAIPAEKPAPAPVEKPPAPVSEKEASPAAEKPATTAEEEDSEAVTPPEKPAPPAVEKPEPFEGAALEGTILPDDEEGCEEP